MFQGITALFVCGDKKHENISQHSCFPDGGRNFSIRSKDTNFTQLLSLNEWRLTATPSVLSDDKKQRYVASVQTYLWSTEKVVDTSFLCGTVNVM
jgi:hypothetical protein